MLVHFVDHRDNGQGMAVSFLVPVWVVGHGQSDRVLEGTGSHLRNTVDFQKACTDMAILGGTWFKTALSRRQRTTMLTWKFRAPDTSDIAVLGIVESHPLDKTGEHLTVG